MKKIYLILIFISMLQTSCDRTSNSEKLHTNFVHTVFFWLHNPDNQDDRQAFERSLKKFLEHSKYAKTKFIGKPALSSRDVVDDSFTYSLVVSFDSKEDQDLYQSEPPHLLFIEESAHLWSKVTVYDSLKIE